MSGTFSLGVGCLFTAFIQVKEDFMFITGAVWAYVWCEVALLWSLVVHFPTRELA
jgi:hypothetical protein